MKKIAWMTNLLNVGILPTMVLKGASPLLSLIPLVIALLTILIVTIPEALTCKPVPTCWFED